VNRSRFLKVLAGATLLSASPLWAQSKGAPPRKPAGPPAAGRRGASQEDLSKLAADVVRTTREYRATLDRLLAVREAEATRAAEDVELRRDLFEAGIISRRELEVSERALAAAQAGVEETRRWIVEADTLIAEALASEQLAKLPPLPRGGYLETAALIRYNGSTRWSLADAPRIQRFFAERFGRPLPISALGQTALHDRIGFDHRHAMDVAVHPDSPEGQGLMGHLRSAGIPFVAFRGAVAGSSTGAHIHIGEESRRLGTSR
jgi:hypothetical protein